MSSDDRPLLAALPEQCYTPAETARILRMSVTTLYRETTRGHIVAIGAGKLRRYSLRHIREYQERNATEVQR